ncbi:MAG TPA: fibronectin type III domain-containing protein, partial [Pyrinomonadaceae bacterium]|nr:fibronectin type III domain-containing protein [Pyrinomonadaceae bacterium]
MKPRMSARLPLILLFAIVLCLSVRGRTDAAAPPAPSPVSPADGAGVTEPFTISWTAVSDPDGIVAYNWQVSASSAFTSVILQNSTGGATQGTVSGLANGTYFWRVQAVNGAFAQGAWSQPRSFTVMGAGEGSPGTPSLAPTKGYSTFHPHEVMTFTWSAIPEAATYVLQFATDPSFPVTTRGEFNNIPDTIQSFAIGNPEGNYFARVFAVDASGTFSAPSNVISFSVFYSNPLPPPPAIVAPVNNPTLTLPVTLTWEHVANPQPSGYEIQIARDSAFTSIEEDDPQLNGPSREVLSLTSGKKFWRVRSAQGDASPTTAALTAWSATGTFTVSSAPPTPVSVTLANDPLYSGETTWVALQLTAAVPAGGATISLSSSNPGAFPVPATVTMPGNIAWTQFQVQAGQVTAPTPVTVTATLNSASASAQFILQPPSLKSFTISPGTISGGAQPQGIVMLNGQAPAGGAVVSLSSNSPMVSPPASVTVAPGSFSASFPIATSNVTANTTATVTASYNGAAAQARVTLTPQQPPASLTLSPTSTTGAGGGSFATVTVASPSPTDEVLQVASSNPAVASVPGGMMIPAGSTTGGFNIFTSAVSAQTVVTISVSGGGVTRTASLTVNPQPPPTPAAPSLLSPGSDAKVAQPINFDWSDASGATSYEIQIDDSNNFTAPLTRSQTVSVSRASVTGLPAQQLFWRVRAFNSAGVAGPFSAARRFTAQAASATPGLSAVSVSPTS